jgi:hypothetical protein
MASPSHSRYGHLNNNGWGIQIMQLLMYFFPLPCYLVPLRPKYSSRHPVLKHSQSTFLPQCDQVSHPYNTTGKFVVLCIVISVSLDSKLEDKGFPDFSLLIISPWIEFRFVRVSNICTLSKELLSVFILWLRPALWSRDMTVYLVSLAFTSRPILLLLSRNHWLWRLQNDISGVCYCSVLSLWKQNVQHAS